LLNASVTKQSVAAMIDSTTTGHDILKVTDLLPNTFQKYGHSTTMNALIKIIVRLIFREQSSIFYTIKVKKGKESSVPPMFASLSQANKQLINNHGHD
jgi:hypothetical protein